MSEYSSEILSEEFLNKYVGKNPNWGFNGLGYVVYKRTYSRLKDNGQSEEWWETIARCINGAQKIGAKYTQDEAEILYDKIFNLKCNFAGRPLWQLGTPTVDRFGANSLLNCWFVAMRKPSDFCFVFENLMLGGGVGFSVKKEDVHEMPKIKKGIIVTHKATNDADFIVPDSREGWVSLLQKVIDAYFNGGKSFSYSTILIRGAGETIKGFGGTASGPIILIEGIEKITSIFKSREGKKLRSIDVLDVCNIIGSVVVAGNVRRSAEIAIGDPDDHLFLRSKRWDLGNIPNWRAMSNNTLGVDSYDQILPVVWEGFEGNGEPFGFFNLPLALKTGRLGDNRKDVCEGVNPCAEILLGDKECCNLMELYLNNIESQEELTTCATLLYKTAKAICALPFIHDETTEVVHKNMRIGVSATGICQSQDKLDWLDNTYKALRKFDKQWSKENNWPESIRLTTVKPSGTVSILAGATPGVHPGFSQFFIRRIRMSSSDKLVNICRKLGYDVEYQQRFDGSLDYETSVVSFPCKYEDGTLLSKNTSAVNQLELVKKIQTVWADNSVSVTVYYKKDELPEIKKWLKDNYEDSLKTVSFLLHSEHGFAQAPYEEITEDKYNKLIKNVKSLTSENIEYESNSIESLECSTGACPVR